MEKQSKKNVGAIVRKSGVTFRVWAPFANSVSVTGTFNNWSDTPLESEKDGYWSIDFDGAEAGQEYKFMITNGSSQFIRNDPRAMQLTTAAGNSVIVDTNFDWDEDDFKIPTQNNQIIYEMHVGTFNRPDPATIGTFETAMAKLDYLADLGVTTIELMPVGAMSMEREWWGYTPEYIFAVENLYGGRYQLLEFVKAAHSKGLAVVLDVVYNHFGPGKNMDLWQFDGWSENDKGGIYFYNDWRSSTPWGDTRPDFGRKEVSQFLLDNARMWLVDFRLDGLRLDSTIFLRNAKGLNDNPDNDLPNGWRLMQRITNMARKINPNSLIIAEDVGTNQYITKPVDEGGAGFTAQWQVNFPHALRNAIVPIYDRDRDIQPIADFLEQKFNDDAFHRVLYADSHDSAANGSSRISEEISPGNPTTIYARKRLLLATTLIMTAPGIPMLLQGQEFMQGGSFNDWEALEWKNIKKFAGIVLAHKHLIALRRNIHNNTAGLQGGSIKNLHVNTDAKVLIYHRRDKGGPNDDVVVVINFSNRKHNDYQLQFPGNGTWVVRFISTWEGYSPDFKTESIPNITTDENGLANLTIPTYTAIILSRDS